MLGRPLLAALPCPSTMPDLAQGPPHHAHTPVQMPADSEHNGMGAKIFPRIPPDDDKVTARHHAHPHMHEPRASTWPSHAGARFPFLTPSQPHAPQVVAALTPFRDDSFNMYVDACLESAERAEPYQVNTAHTIHSGGQGVGCHSHL